MSDQRDIVIKEIKENLKQNLNDENYKQKTEYLSQNIDMNENPNFGDTNHSFFIKNMIKYGLRYKKVIKKIPILGWYSKKIYDSKVLISSKELSSLPRTTATTKHYKLIRYYSRKILILSHILRSFHMLIIAPKKLIELFKDLNLFKSEMKNISVQLKYLNNNSGLIQSEMIKITSKINDSIENQKQVEDLSLSWNKFYSNAVTKEYLESNIDYHKYFIDLIQNFAISTSQDKIPKLIEIGLGTATMSIYFSFHLFEVLGIDLEPFIVEKAIQTNKDLGGYANFISADVMYLPHIFKSKIFDVSFSQGTMEHFDNNELKSVLEAQLYIAKYVILSIPSVNWPTQDFGNERKMTVEEWKTLLTNFGLTLNHLSYYQENNSHIAIVLSE